MKKRTETIVWSAAGCTIALAVVIPLVEIIKEMFFSTEEEV